MEQFYAFLMSLLPGAIVLFICLIFYYLYGKSRKRNAIAFAFGIFCQMFLPDPKVQHTIECVAEKKQEKKSEKSHLNNKE